MKQGILIPKTDEERVAELVEALKKFGKHSMFCGWSRALGFYTSKECTCGLKEAIDG